MEKNNFKIDFIGVGFPRAGTSWIYQCLKEHPQICLSQPKEVNFIKEGLDYYQLSFAHCRPSQLKGEINPAYISEEKAAWLIKHYFPQAKILACLRNPVERAYSHYYYRKGKGAEKALIFESVMKNYLEEGFYYKHLKRYLDLFPQEKILILIYEDIAKDPLKFIQNIYRFLGVDENFVPASWPKKVNPTALWQKNFINKALIRLLEVADWKIKNKKVKHKLKIKPLINFLKKRQQRELKKLAMKTETRRYLQEIYQEDIKHLENLLKRDLSFWQ